MLTHKKILRLVLAGCGAAAMLLTISCETESAATQITITPYSAVVKKDQSVVFTASGGYSYKWSLSNTGIGSLSAKYGDSVTYKSFSSSGTNVITVTGFIEGQSTGTSSTNSTATTTTASYQTAEAYITHYSDETSTAE